MSDGLVDLVIEEPAWTEFLPEIEALAETAAQLALETAGLDPEERRRFLNLLSEIGENIIVILSTHIVGDISELCQLMAIIHQGRVILSGEPLDLASQLEGRVWKKILEKSELPKCEQQFQVISTRLFAGRSLVHVYSQDQPDVTFEPVPPELQDVYFWAIKRHDADRTQSVEAA